MKDNKDYRKGSDILKKELFNMVYQWGRVGVVVDQTAPAFKSVLDSIFILMKAEEKEAGDRLSQEAREMNKL